METSLSLINYWLPLLALLIAVSFASTPSRRELTTASDLVAPKESRPEHNVMQTQGAGYQAAACSEPFYQPSGDFCFLKELHSGQLAFFLGDAMGHGQSAAAYQEMCSRLLRQGMRRHHRPEAVLRSVNDALVQAGHDRYATLLFGLLDPSSGHLTLLSAGHPGPIKMKATGQANLLSCPACLPLGMLGEQQYLTQELRLEPGETLILFSDGLTEARNQHQEFFGEEGLLRLVRRFASHPPAILADAILSEVRAFAPEVDDDQTIMVVRLAAAPALRPRLTVSPELAYVG